MQSVKEYAHPKRLITYELVCMRVGCNSTHLTIRVVLERATQGCDLT